MHSNVIDRHSINTAGLKYATLIEQSDIFGVTVNKIAVNRILPLL